MLEMPTWMKVTISIALASLAFVAAAAVNPACILVFVAGMIFGLINYSSGPFWREMYEEANERSDERFDNYLKEMRLRIQAESHAKKAEAKLNDILKILQPEDQ